MFLLLYPLNPNHLKKSFFYEETLTLRSKPALVESNQPFLHKSTVSTVGRSMLMKRYIEQSICEVKSKSSPKNHFQTKGTLRGVLFFFDFYPKIWYN